MRAETLDQLMEQLAHIQNAANMIAQHALTLRRSPTEFLAEGPYDALIGIRYSLEQTEQHMEHLTENYS